jgi:hypothetical protein
MSKLELVLNLSEPMLIEIGFFVDIYQPLLIPLHHSIKKRWSYEPITPLHIATKRFCDDVCPLILPIIGLLVNLIWQIMNFSKLF